MISAYFLAVQSAVVRVPDQHGRPISCRLSFQSGFTLPGKRLSLD
jgi:hypothetical protein